MRSILKLTAILLLFVSIAGCEEKDKQAKASDPVVFKTQREALDKAKQVESTLQDAAAQQRKTIDESTNSQRQ
jgi:predicted small lipoprotein YifL